MLSSNQKKRFFEEYIYEIDSSNQDKLSLSTKIASSVIIMGLLSYLLFF